MKWRSMAYLLMPWAAKLARDPRILDKVEDLIGPDILIFTSTFFIKEAHSPTIAAWHQDSTYYGIEPKDEVTVWVALTEASEAATAGKSGKMPPGLAKKPEAHPNHVPPPYNPPPIVSPYR